jgi:hypothetical protein
MLRIESSGGACQNAGVTTMTGKVREGSMDFLKDKRVWWAIGIVVVLIILAWAFGWFGGVEEPVTTAPTTTQ